MEEKICMECSYCHYNGKGIYICKHPKSYANTNLVNGIKSFNACEFVRRQKDLCGREGKFFEPKQPLSRRIKDKLLCRTK